MAVTGIAGVGGTGAGGLCACCLRRESDRMVSILLSFAAGVMTGIVCLDLLAEAVGPEGERLLLTASGVLSGCGIIAALERITERRAAVLPGSRRELLLAGAVMAGAIALHNVPEGMLIGTAFAAGETDKGALTLAAVIGAHNVPEGMAVAGPLISGGMGRGRAVAVTAAAGAPTVAGALLGYALGSLGPLTLCAALGFASGAMLYVVFGELLPEASALCRGNGPAVAAVAGILTGLAVLQL